jgi:hypothetical protein
MTRTGGGSGGGGGGGGNSIAKRTTNPARGHQAAIATRDATVRYRRGSINPREMPDYAWTFVSIISGVTFIDLGMQLMTKTEAASPRHAAIISPIDQHCLPQ